jgi:hypothetical protein
VQERERVLRPVHVDLREVADRSADPDQMLVGPERTDAGIAEVVLDGSIGDASEITAEFQNNSQAGMTYPIA